MFKHRIVYIIKNNGGEPIPSHDENGDPLVIRHMCNERSCVNPEHLKLGTMSENSHDDRIVAGTMLHGAKNSNTTITEELARKIKHSKRGREDPDYTTQEQRANFFGTSLSVVESIDRNKSWAYLPDRNGVIKSNHDLRLQVRKRARMAKAEPWTDQDFVDAGEKIKKHVVESDEGKSGEMPPGMCWIWQLSKSRGYGNVSFKRRTSRSHILSCEVKHKRRAQKGEIVRHLCDNTVCCNPNHLVFGSPKDNSRDMVVHGTSKTFKLDPDKVRLIRASKKTNAELAEKYGVKMQAIYI